jgi:rhodanese-related sulfurtransferase
MTSLSIEQFKVFQDSKSQLLDCRPTSIFASSFISNSINASLNGSFEYMASCVFQKTKPLVIICEEGKEGEAFLRLESEGFKDISTFNFEIWKKGGGKTSAIVRYLASEAQKHVDSMKDVSNAEDWKVLHVKGTSSVPLIDLISDFSLVSEGEVLYCGNGHKSMAAASFLKIKGVNVTDIIGGLSAMLVEAPDLEI